MKRVLYLQRVLGLIGGNAPNTGFDPRSNTLADRVLELLKGESLADRLERGVLDWDECWTIMEPVLDALQTAHEAKIVHRDLKPDNIFLSRDGRGRLVPKVLDFGIAQLLQPKRNEHSTQSGALLGTPYYMAPEQAMASKAIGRSRRRPCSFGA